MEEDMDAPEEVTLAAGKQEANKLRKTERENERRVATEAKQKRKQQAKKKEELRLQLEKELRGTKEDTRLNKYLPLSEQPLEISGQEELGPKQLLNSASDAAQEYQEVLNKEGMLPDSIVNFLVGREKQSQFDSDEKVAKGPTAILKPRKKKMKIKHGSNEMGRVQLVLLNDVSTLDCVQNAKEFRQSRQSHVRRSSSMLHHANSAFTFLSKQGLLPSH